MKELLKVLAVGDVVGRVGRNILLGKLQGLIDKYRLDVVIVNGENSAGGISITPEIVREFKSNGVDIITTGNHVFDKSEIFQIIGSEEFLLRPANYPDGVAGHGYCIYTYKGWKLAVINLLGRTLMTAVDCPFRKFDEIYEKIKDSVNGIVVDFHAEATSEKRAFGWYVNGRASLVYGTHTHVQTADEEILSEGTGYITDIGMTGSFDSVIGLNKEYSIQRFLTQVRTKFEVAKNDLRINGILFDLDSTGKTVRINRIVER